MPSYRLVDHGYSSFKKIMHGRDWIGRVGRHADGGFIGTIGNESVRAQTEIAAFEEAVARHMGYPNAATLKGVRTKARQAKHMLDEMADYAMDEALDRCNFIPFEKMLMHPPTSEALVRAFRRKLCS